MVRAPAKGSCNASGGRAVGPAPQAFVLGEAVAQRGVRVGDFQAQMVVAQDDLFDAHTEAAGVGRFNCVAGAG
jgi:hypothetical protein